jgi:LDH2 family malate/lactate/ureidoglycolate dehydrogenase
MQSEKTIASPALCDLAKAILIASGVPAAKAGLVAESLVAANLRGVDSHGIYLLPHYIRQLRAGNIVAAADGHIISESDACLLYDGEHGIGQCVSEICCGHAVRLARHSGVGMVVARDSNHFGAAAFWAQRISAAGMIGIVMCNASPSVPPWQGRDGRIGTNPLCVSVPSVRSGGWLLDMATTTVAMNRIVKAASNNEPNLPAGWAMDAQGVPTTDTQTALKGLLMPLGGYKGSGLGMMAEILCAVLGGGAMSTAVGGLHILNRAMNTSQTFLAVDVSRFMSMEVFQSRMEHLVGAVKSARPAQGYDEVLVAGDPEWRMEGDRLRNGVPVDPATWSRLAALAAELGVTLP